MEKLKPCPFCPSGKGVAFKDNYDKYGVYCNSCNSQTGLYSTIDDAVTAWNTRPDSWISVGTMPDRCGMSVLLVGVNRYEQTRVFQGFTGYMETGRLLFYSNIGDVDINNWDVTHWQPLPEPPKGDEN